VSLEEALDRVMTRVAPLEETETVPLDEAFERVLAMDVDADMDVPAFERAAMDGYAVKAQDTYGASDLEPVALTPIGTVHAGEVPTASVSEGEAMYVATGAMRPEGTDAVVMVEYTEEVEGRVLVRRPVHPGENVSNRGSDIKRGTTPLRTGMRLGASRVGTAAALGLTEIQVFRRPAVAIAATGNEVCPLGEELGPGQVYDINTHTIAGAIHHAGGIPIVLGLVEDSMEALRTALEEALAMADVVVFTGGSSVGERDLLVDVFAEAGEVLFHGVQVKPGKPVLAADCDGKLALGLPGYPTSCLSSGMLFLGPILARMGRLPGTGRATMEGELGRRVVSTIGRTHFMTVRIEKGIVHPAFKESGAITSMAEADGYIIIPSDVDLVEKGERVEVNLL
jgi:molybdenum cofactor synthesis domain-containing protein